MDVNELTSTDDEVRVVGDFVVATLTPSTDLEAVESLTCAIDAALQDHGLLRVLLNRRGEAALGDDARELLCAWIEGCRFHDRVAVVDRSSLERTQARPDPLHVRWFQQLNAAVEWLCSASPPLEHAV